MNAVVSSPFATTQGNHADRIYADFLQRVQSRFMANVFPGGERQPLFTTDVDPGKLWNVYLKVFPAHERQYHNCNACRQFLQRYASLVVIDENGKAKSAMFNRADVEGTPYFEEVDAILRMVDKAKVTGVFYSDERRLGTPKTGNWIHFGLTMLKDDRKTLQTAHQQMAEKLQDHEILVRSLDEFKLPVAMEAVRVLESDSLYRSEKVLGPARWFADLQTNITGKQAVIRNNLVWRAAATAPAGFAHIRSTMIGTLLEDIAAGMSFTEVQRRFREKMNPTVYQRPQAAPTLGNIKQAEKLIDKLGLEPALHRRIATIEEIPLLWSPRAARDPLPTGTGVFGHLQPKGAVQPPATGYNIPGGAITLEKFARTVAPTADKIEVQLGLSAHFIAITTAMHADAPPVFQWDHPFAWYVWQRASALSQYGLRPGWVELSGITRLPARWNDDANRFAHQGDGLIFLLKDARETHSASAALFPELLRGELREVRSTIEAHSNSTRMKGLLTGSAVGLDVRSGKSACYPLTVRVTSGGKQTTYSIDRWD